MFVDVLLNVLAIIGIIIAGGFLIFFLGDLVISIVDGKNSSVFGSKKYTNHNEHERPNVLNQEYNPAQHHTVSPYFSNTQKDDFAKTGTLEMASGKPETVFSNKGWQEVDEEQARIEKMMLENSNQLKDQPISVVSNTVEKTTEGSAIDQLRKEEEEFKRKSLENVSSRKNESVFPKTTTTTTTTNSISRTKTDETLDFGDLFFDDSKNDDSDDDDVDFEALLAELTSKSEKNELNKEEETFLEKQVEESDALSAFLKEEDEEFEEETEEVEEETEDAEEKEQVEVVNDERDKIREELELLREMLAQKEKENAALQETAQTELKKTKSDLEHLRSELQKAKQDYETKPQEGALLSEEEYVSLIERLTARLKTNEKELKSVKREFLPLARVKKSLENDKKKLRRKEATVAKQKVILYGVNNYVDIDEDKAKQLAEDLDLLDGLKLSVEHCESVMEQNKERYPLLENTYRILKDSNKALKNDIQDLNEQLAKVKVSQED